jgi:hypothetical protein
LLDKGFLPKDVPFDTVFSSAEQVYMAKSVLFSPSVGYQATAHNKNGKPVRQPISEAIWSLNDSADRLDDYVSTFGHIFSVELRLGENAIFDFDLLDAGDVLARLVPGSFTKIRRFVLHNIGRDNNGNLIGHGDNGSWRCTQGDRSNLNNWACNGDGIAPTISQRMTRIPGFSPGSKPFHPKLLQGIPHLGETGQVGAIKEVLDIMVNDLK